MTVTSALTALRLVTTVGVILAVQIYAFNITVPDAVEQIASRGWFAVVVNYVATTGFVMLCLTGLGFLLYSLLVAPLVRFLLRLTETGRLIVDIIELIDRMREASARSNVRRAQVRGEDWDPLLGEFMQPGNGFLNNLCLLLQIGAYPIAVLIVALLLQFHHVLF